MGTSAVVDSTVVDTVGAVVEVVVEAVEAAVVDAPVVRPCPSHSEHMVVVGACPHLGTWFPVVPPIETFPSSNQRRTMSDIWNSN